jgi:hypothetical protein
MIETVFALTENKVEGYFVGMALASPYGVRGRQAEEVIGRWFTSDPGFNMPENGPDLNACGQGEDKDNSFPPGISGFVHYSGDKLGIARVSIRDYHPPAGPPLASALVDEETGEFHADLPPGLYYLMAVVGSGDRYQPGDPVITCGPVELDADESIVVEFALDDSESNLDEMHECIFVEP